MRSNMMFVPVTVLVASLLFSGCQKSENTAQNQAAELADPHDVPITEADVQMPSNYAEAVDRVKSYRDAIRDAAGSDTPGLAHRPLDELDIVLQKLAAIARDSGVPAESLKTVNLSARELRNLFNEVHAAIDEKRPPNFSAVAERIEQAIGRLETAVPTIGG